MSDILTTSLLLMSVVFFILGIVCFIKHETIEGLLLLILGWVISIAAKVSIQCT